ncbi:MULTISPECIES: hypothetical protein [Aeromonas]|uniref:DUF4376 domain-containing protein n=1 Tax=Aeromonas veronii TaxID=654 RepID=A0AAX2UNQ0_AERVE|nr:MULTISPECIES: hypothetical protein [Aeromonas]QWZ66357.1 hypothetical protein I6L47_22165 [Aeromonas sp. FDAARGOS 1417]TND51868.1 hypothetical protein CF123_18540 [Aeromonas veronii]
MNRLLKVYYLPNYDETSHNIALVVGADCDGHQRWLCMSANESTSISGREPNYLFAKEVVGSQEEAEAWLEHWRNRIADISRLYVLQCETTFSVVKDAQDWLASRTKFFGSVGLSKHIAMFCVSACAGDAPISELAEEVVARSFFQEGRLERPLARVAPAVPVTQEVNDSLAEMLAMIEREEDEEELERIVDEECRRLANPGWGMFE